MRAVNSPTAAISTVLGPVIRFAVRLRDAGERRRVIHNLASLDDHMLRDIGLTRFDVDAALVEPAAKDATLLLAERARDLRRHQRAMSQEAQAWVTMMPEADGRGAQTLVRRVA